MRNITLSIVIALSSAQALPALAQSNTSLAQVSSATQQYSDAELDSALAPIALYPDTLLTHILIASTYPLDVVAADRWRQSNKHLTPEQVEGVLDGVSWDPSVKALAPFTELLNTMANDLEWLQQLGDNVLIDQSRVLDRVQVLRQHAHNTGNLVTNDYIEVERERESTREIIYIEPRNREVVYVPYYDPHVVYGHWWHPVSPIRWRHHVSYHHHSNVYWSPSVRLSAFFFFGGVHWHNRHVVIHREPLRKYYHGSPRKRVVSRDYRRWEHNAVHRRARYSNRVVHSAPARYEHSGVTRAKHVSNKHIRTANRATHNDNKRSVKSVTRTDNAKPIKRTIEPKQVTPLRESRLQRKQDTVKRKQSIEHALKRNQAVASSKRPTRDNTLKALKQDKPARITSVSESKRYANQGQTTQRPTKQNINRQRVERTSPQHRSIARETSKPKRIERASSNRSVKHTSRDKSQRQISRVERSASKGNSYKH
ncbi:DUF3300 domain-containing protein [Alteromonas sp. BL110]|uniref:DUF3300 domain-containing protein n=1 Tax=Alteromonas sp. BL110 TaxID=1714845 RepID=UPI000E52BADE|nr:DUF3300 domain-containing protein [Alteromonas sp. BL110]AXT38373.1 DUF3300 domain-containing protein [Alteromonas sp. BL110]RKM83883.1 DUF3300 domain-containing protein [Alteromonas sp. BL110]